MVTGVVPSPPRFLPSTFIAHRVQQSHCCSSIFHRVLLTHALALSASQFMHKKKSQQIYTSMHSAGLELTKLTYTRLEYNLIRHRGDRRVINLGDIMQKNILRSIMLSCLRAISSGSRSFEDRSSYYGSRLKKCLQNVTETPEHFFCFRH